MSEWFITFGGWRRASDARLRWGLWVYPAVAAFFVLGIASTPFGADDDDLLPRWAIIPVLVFMASTNCLFALGAHAEDRRRKRANAALEK